MRDTQWFARFGDIRGVEYVGRPEIDRSKLPGFASTPSVRVVEFDGKRRESLEWPGLEPSTYSTGRAPASEWMDRSTDRKLPLMVQILHEALELPGQPADYHFAIQGCCDVLWNHRDEEPWILVEIENLCLLDIQLIESCPEAITFESVDNPGHYAYVKAFEFLIKMYVQEEYLQDALDVGRKAMVFHQQPVAVEKLAERLSNANAEHAS